MTPRHVRITLLLIPLLLIGLFAHAQEKGKAFTGKVVGVTDGDTFTVLDADKAQHKVRLHGIDTPERGQAFGTKAKQALSDLVFDKEVTVAVTDVDRYKRLVGRVKQGDTDVNAEMVRSGFAWRYPQYDKAGEFTKAQEEAKAAKKGLWADADPTPPWEYRKGTKAEEPAAGKGEVYATNSGAKYHAEGCRFLAKSKLTLTLAEAKKQGLEPCSGCKP
jgi:endonuclease YncB( thermonuclease family)